MGRFWGGIALVVLASFMALGYAQSDAAGLPAILALGLVVLLPGGAGVAMIASHYRHRGALAGRKEDLRRQTIEAELLRVAGRRGGKLTVVEAVSDLAVSPEDAKEGLDALALRGIADYEVTESGVVVYAVHDIQRVGDKADAKGLLQ